MNSTPNANRKHIAVFGKTNAGKSSLINRFLGQEVSLVSEKEGTTTDPVQKAMELIPVGPVLIIDTAGFGDKSELGEVRVKRTLDILKRTDVAIYLFDINDIDLEEFKEAKRNFKKYNIPYVVVINKSDSVNENILEELQIKFKDSIFLSSNTGEGIELLKEKLIEILKEEEEELPIVGDLLPYNSKVILVVPIDSEAPKGRIILPQVQCIRDCLDHGIKSYVVRDTELESALEELEGVDLVITDSQAFKEVDRIVPKNIKLTSFSMLFARQKGDFEEFIKGALKIKDLNKDSRVLIAESCTHNVSHEDIGRVKIPKLLNKYVGADLTYDHSIFHDFPEDIDKYDLIIHCGACMINRKTVINRVKQCKEKNVPITNYGIVLAYLNGILERSLSLFNTKKGDII
ncbi:[FeFe] hydrogenase H-cluster maturation GTPase HydF [Clostridium tertium]|jgi:[FeFe] hydrogenase H-cluster maturation GTPase HydF|uniref:[FeFe] hydrogenase H-cluster maturation GTPase HydF n=1 Tax=Clostridium tertium TaxID=1559 RepID=A0A9X3XME9_9CLOT|nr:MULTISPECIES: [FeFe] hydrogenase H-cluster maturation GTPase HydF [Clostridium]EEH98498.1 hydrogenase maturation GTPase HydF [Clostridium sp. 7_2_43FAA]MBU6137093.1 [FeFe] hydrogenase H-cluster maturation GTPase HydF [Clostridium tertium]MDB1939502.1 [FeFe] hydrogenase H-cluster maturation GTPase HydF [Clostridium tertium]MDB1949621.1 [FeFe] hydrogenase H-cluster maturation GTPase HydF [Clostridium tertium]MDB1954269.1 [FeFe] hydrogenase H-cluster maturation GTPase HydF [Clostridium tertium